jgi:hypothetical protein
MIKYNRFYSIGTTALAALGIFLAGLSSNIKILKWQILFMFISASIAGLGLFFKTQKD